MKRNYHYLAFMLTLASWPAVVILVFLLLVAACPAFAQRRPGTGRTRPPEPICSPSAMQFLADNPAWTAAWPWLYLECHLIDWWQTVGGDFPVEVCGLTDATGDPLYDAFGIIYPRVVRVDPPQQDPPTLPRCTGVPDWNEWPYNYSPKFDPRSFPGTATYDVFDVRESTNVITVFDAFGDGRPFRAYINSSCLSGPPQLVARRCTMPATAQINRQVRAAVLSQFDAAVDDAIEAIPASIVIQQLLDQSYQEWTRTLAEIEWASARVRSAEVASSLLVARSEYEEAAATAERAVRNGDFGRAGERIRRMAVVREGIATAIRTAVQ